MKSKAYFPIDKNNSNEEYDEGKGVENHKLVNYQSLLMDARVNMRTVIKACIPTSRLSLVRMTCLPINAVGMSTGLKNIIQYTLAYEKITSTRAV